MKRIIIKNDKIFSKIRTINTCAINNNNLPSTDGRKDIISNKDKSMINENAKAIGKNKPILTCNKNKHQNKKLSSRNYCTEVTRSSEINDRLMQDESWIVEHAWNLQYGINCTKNKEESNKLLERMMLNGNKLSKLILYLNGEINIEIEQEEMETMLKDSISKDNKNYTDSIALHLLGMIKENSGDVLNAIKYYEMSTNPQSMNSLAEIYLLGNKRIKKNTVKAINYLEKASELGSSESLFHLYKIYSFGVGVEKDVTKGLDYLDRACNIGCEESMFVLGNIYEKGTNHVEKDMHKALSYYHRSSELGNVHSLVRLGNIYNKGSQGIEKNVQKAVFYFEKASELGNTFSQNQLDAIFNRDSNDISDNDNTINPKSVGRSSQVDRLTLYTGLGFPQTIKKNIFA